MFDPPWRDPKTDPPGDYENVIVTTEAGRVTSCLYYKGKFATYTPILAWQPMPAPAKVKRDKPTADGEPPAKKTRKAVRRK